MTHYAPQTNDGKLLHDWMNKYGKVRGSITVDKNGKPYKAIDISLLDETLGYFITLRKNIFDSPPKRDREEK